MGHKHSRQDILDCAVAVATEEGLSRLSFGRVAKFAGTSDRVVVYYFPNKQDMIGAVMQAIGGELQATLAGAVPERAKDHIELCQAAWPTLSQPESARAFALFFEANGLAATGIEPYATMIPQMISAWIDWVTQHLDGPPAQRQVEAECTVALLDGLLLFRQTAGHQATMRVAKRLGFALPDAN